jgi:hypothetical protein
MNRIRVYSAVAAAFLMLPSLVPGETAEPRLVVRIYDNYRVPSKHVEEARRVVDEIFQRAGVSILWLDCWRGRRAAVVPRCRETAAINEIILRLQASAPVTDQPAPLGLSLLNVVSGTPFFATVYPDRVKSTARASNATFGTLLGRVVAHEIGHLLLNRNTHAGTGLMKAHWNRDDLNRKDWSFADDEVATIQAAAERRSMRPAALAAAR